MLKVIKSAPEIPSAQLVRIYGEGRTVDYLRHDFYRVNGAMCCLWIEDGDCVSAARLEPWRDGWLLTGLQTASDRQRQGYATQLMRSIVSLLKSQGSLKLYSHIRKNNIASVRAHEKCGFCKISDMAAYVDGSVDGKSFTYLYMVK